MTDETNQVIIVKEDQILDFLTPDKLIELIDPKNPTLLESWGGVTGVAKSIGSNIERGLPNNETYYTLIEY